ncbi:hypothetical protein R3P38DRAFT_3228568 [Favolaschia claudopus]|uniref:Uncharacterized protein n=1 Tax=Favolaschia claudopus TaxID=2862362 RepID=A0AAV9ZQC5_9AGAR
MPMHQGLTDVPKSPWAYFSRIRMVCMHAAKGKTYDNYYKLVDTGDLYLGRENSLQVLRVLTSSPAIQAVGQSNSSQRLVVINPLEWSPVTNSSSGNPIGGTNTIATPPGLPDFVRARWGDFLSTLYRKLGAIDGNPWVLPGGDVAWIQEAFDRVYYGSGYKVKLGCPVYIKAKDRLNDKRSYFGRRAIAVVDTLFRTEEYVGKSRQIAKFAKDALRDDGPGIWGVPAPSGLKKTDQGYVPPDEVFASPYVIAVFAPFIKSAAGSAYNYGYAGAALALTMTALERAWMKWITGVKVEDNTPFSREHVSVLFDDYYKSVSSLSPRRWKVIMEKVGVYNAEDAPLPATASTLEANRHQLFIPSSP